MCGTHAVSGMPVIAVTTVGVSRTVTEYRPGPAAGRDDVVAVVGRVRPHDDQPGRTHPARSGQRIGHQLPAPRAELVDPFRSRVAAISGAEIGVETTANRALRPLTPVYPRPAPFLAYP